VDDHDVDAADADVGEQLLQCRPLDVATREPAIVVMGSGQHPSLVLLAADEGFAGLVLGGERIELLFQPFLGRFASVDRAALALRLSFSHRSSLLHRQPGPMLARTGGSPTDTVSARRTAVPTTACR